jgi:hypothetical protein
MTHPITPQLELVQKWASGVLAEKPWSITSRC